MAKPVQKSGLGRGLSALINNSDSDLGKSSASINSISHINLEDIEANPFQPRADFNEETMQELVDSIKIHGVIQPITVRKQNDGKYALISGERRTRASRLAGLLTIPAFIRVASDQAMIEMALIENTHRENLNPIEIALSYQQLVDEIHLSHEQLAERVGKNRSTVANFIRLLKLPDFIQVALKQNQISTGHARALAGIENKELQQEIFRKVLEEDLTVRGIEKLIRDSVGKPVPAKKEDPIKKDNQVNPYLDKEQAASKYFNSEVKISATKTGKGQMIISFNSKEELERIVETLGIN